MALPTPATSKRAFIGFSVIGGGARTAPRVISLAKT
jgi:hypothetical protein